MSPRFDWVVVERLLAGVPTPIHPDERDATARELMRRGMPSYRIADLLGMSYATVAQAVAA